MDSVDIAIVGGGVVGCAIASFLAETTSSVMLFESEGDIGEGVTGRNSGVVHSGIYYSPNSLKAETCIEGNRRLYEWCGRNNVAHKKTGKLIVAKEAQELEEIEFLQANARECGAHGVTLISRSELAKREPEVTGVAALFCPESGIVDPIELTRSLLSHAIEEGADFAPRSRVSEISRDGTAYVLQTERGEIRAERVINAGGLGADDIARMAGIERYRIYPCRGDYFRLKSKPFYRHLIYPAKRRSAPGLGIHLTFDLAGAYRLGPDAEYVTEKKPTSSGENKRERFRVAAERLLGPIEEHQLEYDTFGIRPKLRGPEDIEEKDFVVSEDLPGLINVVGIESPGLTAALALATRVCSLM